MIYIKIKDLILQYRKTKNYTLLSKLTTLQSDILTICKSLKIPESEITDSHCINILNRYIKNIDECIKYITNSEELVEERDLYISFLPAKLSTEELISIIRQHKDMKSLMPFLKSNYEGQYTPSEIPSLFKEHNGT